MEEILHADIFFFITAVAVIVLTIALLFVIYYIFRIVKTLKDLAENLKVHAESIMETLDEEASQLPRGVKKYGKSVAGFAATAFGSYLKKKMRKRKKK